ncbi:MAG: hypothetical protein GY861_17040 [bacterium]|nr:hypothetical protein [bacterium]
MNYGTQFIIIGLVLIGLALGAICGWHFFNYVLKPWFVRRDKQYIWDFDNLNYHRFEQKYGIMAREAERRYKRAKIRVKL